MGRRVTRRTTRTKTKRSCERTVAGAHRQVLRSSTGTQAFQEPMAFLNHLCLVAQDFRHSTSTSAGLQAVCSFTKTILAGSCGVLAGSLVMILVISAVLGCMTCRFGSIPETVKSKGVDQRWP